MSREPHHPTVFDSIDSDTRLAIIALNQKLINLQKEIQLKLFGLNNEDKKTAKKAQLIALGNEVTLALESIHHVVNMVVSEGLNTHDFLKTHHDEIEAFREMVTLNAEKIAKINEKL